MTKLGALIMLVSLSLLSACVGEGEESCYERLSKDFGDHAGLVDEAIKINTIGHRGSDTSKSNASLSAEKLAALGSAVEILTIYSDNDRDACDYVSAGAYLQRK